MDELQYLIPNEPLRFSLADLDILLEHCYRNNTSDVTIQTNEPIFAEIYGRLHHITRRSLTQSEVGNLLNAIYGPNGTTQILSGTDIDTNYEVRPNRLDRFRFRVNATGCLIEGHQGIQITLRVIPTDPPMLSSLELPQDIRDAIAPEQGVVYITGATGSGKSTLLAAIIRHIAENPDCNRKILTYEAPIEFVYDNVSKPTCIISQSEIPYNLPSFAAGVRNALRRKPRLILVGESRDTETISAVLEAALTGHPVYTTVHSNGVSETIRRLVGSFPAEERIGRTIDIIETIRLIIWQMLVPTVEGKRTPLREYLIFNEEVREELLSTDPVNVTAMTRNIVKRHKHTMLDDAQQKYDENIISEVTLKRIQRSQESMDADLISS